MTRRLFMQMLAMFGLSTRIEAQPPLPAQLTDCCVLCGYTEHLKTWRIGKGFRWDAKRQAFFPEDNKLPDFPDDALRCADPGGCQARQMNTYLGTQTNWQRDHQPNGRQKHDNQRNR